ncbi:MAG: sugar ABC transporter permease, partial [Acetobacteraceae bacterium]|nr:sugar ABC transporter permease [Acetobacteraceae bacterium]
MSVAASAPVVAARRPASGTAGGRVNTKPLVWPSVGLLLVWSLIPLALTLWYSFRRYNLL